MIHRANYQATVIAPCEVGTPPGLCFLIMDVHILLINLIMILAVGAYGKVRVEYDPAVLWAKKPGVGVAHGRVDAQAVNIDAADARRNAVQLGLLPANRKRNRRAEERIEIECISGIFPKIADIQHDP